MDDFSCWMCKRKNLSSQELSSFIIGPVGVCLCCVEACEVGRAVMMMEPARHLLRKIHGWETWNALDPDTDPSEGYTPLEALKAAGLCK